MKLREIADTKIVGYKRLFGFVLPDWVDERTIKLIAFSLVSVAVFILVLIFVIWPNMRLADTKSAVLESNLSALATLKKSKEGIDSMQTVLSQGDQKSVLFAIPTQYSPEMAIFSLRTISNDIGVAIVSYTLPSGVLLESSAPAVAGKTQSADMVVFSSFPIKLVVAAPVESLLKFISKIESTLPFGIVSDLNIQEVTKLSKLVSGKSVQLSLEVTYYQSRLSAVNINKLERFTETDIDLAKTLGVFNVLEAGTTSDLGSDSEIATGSGNVFGF